MVCNKEYIWNSSNCACECDKSCDVCQHLDYTNCVCRNSLVDKLVEECTNVIDGDTIYNETLTVTSLHCHMYPIYCIIYCISINKCNN